MDDNYGYQNIKGYDAGVINTFDIHSESTTQLKRNKV